VAAALGVSQGLIGFDEPSSLIGHPAIAPLKVVGVITLDQRRPALADLRGGRGRGYAEHFVIGSAPRQNQTSQQELGTSRQFLGRDLGFGGYMAHHLGIARALTAGKIG
jgi:hypothetical protein